MDEYFNSHYLTIDAQARILDGWSDGPFPDRDTAGAVLLTAQGGYQFRLFNGGAENPALFTMDGIPLYAWHDGVFRRTEEEIEADREELPKPEPPVSPGVPAGLVEKVEDLGAAMTLLLEGLT